LRVRIGLGLYPDEPAGKLIATAQLAEELGYTMLWMPDSQVLWREMYALLGAAAVSTRRIDLGSAVTNLITRHPSVAASGFRTLDELSGGRMRLGLGIGDSAVATLDLKPQRVEHFSTALEQLRGLLAGGEDASPRLAFGADRPIPIYIAASGPRMLALAGRLADGVILMNGVAPELIAAAIALVRQGAQEAARDPAKIQVVVWAACHTTPDAVKYNVARTILRNLPGPLEPLTRETAEAVRTRYDYAQHGNARANFAELIPDELVPRFAFTGTPNEIAGQIAALECIGVDEVALAIPSAAPSASRDAVLEVLAPALL
jgi:5,10-methylenetetrahydromethanopterin reductase